MNRFSEETPSLAAHRARIFGDEEKQYCAVCDSSHYAPICEPEPEEETGCTDAEQVAAPAFEPMQGSLFPQPPARTFGIASIGPGMFIRTAPRRKGGPR